MKRVTLLFGLVLAAALASGQIAITTPSLPDGYTNGIFYSQALAVTITPPNNTSNTTLTWSITAGATPYRHLVHLIEQPTALRLDDDNAQRAHRLEIDSEDGSTTVLRLE